MEFKKIIERQLCGSDAQNELMCSYSYKYSGKEVVIGSLYGDIQSLGIGI